MTNQHPVPAGWAERLARTLDALGVAVALFDRRSGRLVHTAPALERLLEHDAERARLEAELRASAQAGRVAARRRGESVPTRFSKLEREVRTAALTYRIGVSQAQRVFGAEDVIMVRLEPAVPQLPEEGLLSERFGLTGAEARVARLLAEGKTNAQIADALSISPHTAERHTEKVFQKLGVHSRAAVGPALLER